MSNSMPAQSPKVQDADVSPATARQMCLPGYPMPSNPAVLLNPSLVRTPSPGGHPVHHYKKIMENTPMVQGVSPQVVATPAKKPLTVKGLTLDDDCGSGGAGLSSEPTSNRYTQLSLGNSGHKPSAILEAEELTPLVLDFDSPGSSPPGPKKRMLLTPESPLPKPKKSKSTFFVEEEPCTMSTAASSSSSAPQTKEKKMTTLEDFFTKLNFAQDSQGGDDSHDEIQLTQNC